MSSGEGDASSSAGAASTPDGPYALSLSLLSDGEPVRALCRVVASSAKDSSSSDSSDSSAAAARRGAFRLIAGSQGGIVACHAVDVASASVGTSLQPGGDGTRHPHQISALAAVPSSVPGFGGGGYVSGCKDAAVRVFGPDHALVSTLEGHQNAVTSLSWLELSDGGGAPPPLLVSGSWDGTAKLWDLATGQCVATLGGHENTVNVAGLPPPSGGGGGGGGAGLTGRLVTTSAGVAEGGAIRDHRVRIWEMTMPRRDSPAAQPSLKHTVSNDHSGPIRGVAYDVETDRIVTASNDGTVKLRDGRTGECAATLAVPVTAARGQPPLLLSVACLGGGKYAAATEDGNAVVWDAAGTSEPQVLAHPNCVWAVLRLPGPGGDDGGAHGDDLATASQDGLVRIWTRDPARRAEEGLIAQLEKEVSEARAKTSGGPTPEEIAKLPKWEMNALQQGRSEGQVQVFNKDGRAIAAQWSATSGTWIEVGEVTGTNQNAGTIDGVQYDHVFPIEVDVAGGGVQKLQIGYNNGENPFVTAQKFIDDNMLDQNYLAEIADYIQKRVGDQGPTLGMGGSGGGGGGGAPAVQSGAVPMDVAPAPAPAYKHLPARGFVSFATGADAKGFSKITAKIREFNTSLTTNLEAAELERIDALCSTLSSTNRYHATTVSARELDALMKMIRNWDAERVFPALDLARLAVLHPDAASPSRREYWSEVVGLALDKCRRAGENPDPSSRTTAVAVPMLSLRLFANCFKGGAGSRDAAASRLPDVLDCAESYASSANKNVRLSVATVALNAASHLASSDPSSASSGAAAAGEKVLSLVGTAVGSGLYETEATVRALVALGTALLAGGDAVRAKARELHVSSMAQHAASRHGEKARGVAEEIRSILQ